MNTDSTPNIERIVREAADSIHELARAAGALPLREQLVTLHAAGKMAGHLLTVAGLDPAEIAGESRELAAEVQPDVTEAVQLAGSTAVATEIHQASSPISLSRGVSVPEETLPHPEAAPASSEQDTRSPSLGEMIVNSRDGSVKLFGKSKLRIIRLFDFLETQPEPVSPQDIIDSKVLLLPGENADEAAAKSIWDRTRNAIKRQGLQRFLEKSGDTTTRAYTLHADNVKTAFPDYASALPKAVTAELPSTDQTETIGSDDSVDSHPEASTGDANETSETEILAEPSESLLSDDFTINAYPPNQRKAVLRARRLALYLAQKGSFYRSDVQELMLDEDEVLGDIAEGAMGMRIKNALNKLERDPLFAGKIQPVQRPKRRIEYVFTDYALSEVDQTTPEPVEPVNPDALVEAARELQAALPSTSETDLTTAVPAEPEAADDASAEAVEQHLSPEAEPSVDIPADTAGIYEETPEPDVEADAADEELGSQVVLAFQKAVGDETLPEQFMPLTSTGVGYTEDENGKRTYYLANQPQYIHGLAKDTFELLLERPQGEIDFELLRQKLAEKTGRTIDINPLNRALTDLEHRFGRSGGFFSTPRKVGEMYYRYVGIRGILTEEERGEVEDFLAQRDKTPQSNTGVASEPAPPTPRLMPARQPAPTPAPRRRVASSPAPQNGSTIPKRFLRTQADQEMLVASYGKKGVRLVEFMEANVNKEVTNEDLLRLFPDDDLKVSQVLAQNTLDIMASTPEYVGRITQGERGYERILLPESARTKSVEEHLSPTAAEFLRLVRANKHGVMLGAAIHAVGVRFGKKPEFADATAAIGELKLFFGPRFVMEPNGSPGSAMLRLLSAEDMVYSRRGQKAV